VNGPYTASNEKQVLINSISIILDTQVNGPYTASNEKQVLINKAFPALPEVAVKYIWRRRLLPPACDREKDCRLPRNWARQS